jgi:hypothetical protein
LTLLEKLKSLFTRDEIPDEAKAIFDKATTPTELLRGLDTLLTRNEVEAAELNAEINRVEARALDEEERVRSGDMPERQKRNSLLQIKRLRKQLDNYESRLRIYERNMNLHLTLIGKIQQVEAMKLRGVDEGKIDQIVMDFEEKLEQYGDVMNAAEAHEGRTSTASAREERELRELESEILSKNRPVTETPPARDLRQVEAALKARERPMVEPSHGDSPVDGEKPDIDATPRRRPIEEVVDGALEDERQPATRTEPRKVELE